MRRANARHFSLSNLNTGESYPPPLRSPSSRSRAILLSTRLNAAWFRNIAKFRVILARPRIFPFPPYEPIFLRPNYYRNIVC